MCSLVGSVIRRRAEISFLKQLQFSLVLITLNWITIYQNGWYTSSNSCHTPIVNRIDTER